MALPFNHIDDLIGKLLAGEATEAESAEVQAWCAQNEGNQKYFDDLKAIFERAASIPVQEQFNTDAAWQRVKSKLKPENVVPLRREANYWPVLRLAAGIVLLLSVGIYAYRWFAQPVQTIAVVSDSATLENTLPDSSTVFLNRHSQVTYEYNPRQKTRKVKLQGEGFFEVKHEEEKPFVIETEGVFVRDIGTAFNVKSYPEKDTVEVIVQSGEVQFYTLKDPGINLKAGETGIYTKRGKVFTKIPRADTNALAYKTRIFSFYATDLRSVIDRVNEVYGSKLTLANEQLANCRLTTTFSNESLDAIVEIIAETMSLTVVRKDDEIILNGAGCQ